MGLDWDDLRVFLQVARSGQMAGAARVLGIDHSTISRRISRLERQLGTACFDRAGKRLRITEKGKALMRAAGAVETVLLRDVASVGVGDPEISGCVRIGTSEGFGAFYLARRMAAITMGHPGLSIELVAMPRTYSLAAREVDLLITMDRPSTGNLRIKKLTSYGMGLFASSAYLAEHGQPAVQEELDRHQWCGYIEELLFTDELRYLTFGVLKIEPRYRTTSVTAQFEAIRSGGMIGILPLFMADGVPDLERLLPAVVAPRRDYWLVVHEDLANVPRVRSAMDAIEEQVRADRSLFD